MPYFVLFQDANIQLVSRKKLCHVDFYSKYHKFKILFYIDIFLRKKFGRTQL